jgi:regulator of sirC expression with transglutaminase-like and TPR domain
VLRGEIRERQGDVPGALADYRAALERGPDGSVRAALERRIGELQRR